MDSAQDEADRRRRTAGEDVEIISAEGRARADEMIAHAKQEVADLAQQRETIAAQLETLRQTLAAAARPLGSGEPGA